MNSPSISASRTAPAVVRHSSPIESGTDVLLVSELYPPAIGGSAVLFQNVYERFSRYSVSVLTDRESSPGEDGDQGGLYVYRRRFATRRWGVLGLGPLHDHWRTITAIRSIPRGPKALIHCARALPEAVSTLLGYPLLRRRYLCWAHGEELTEARLSREYAFLIKRAFSSAAAVLANSHNTLRLLEEIGLPPEHVAVVHPGVDASRFTPDVDGTQLRQQFAPHGETLICTIARLQRRKGHDHAIAAVAAVAQYTPDVRYLIVGDGEERRRLELLV